MTSLRRKSQFLPSKPFSSVPRPRAPRDGEGTPRRGGARQQSKVDERIRSRRMSIVRYAGPGVGSHGDANYLASDPYQYTLDVAPPLLEGDEYADEPDSITAELVRPPSLYRHQSPAMPEMHHYEDEGDAQEAEEQFQQTHDEDEEQIRERAPDEHAEWDFRELSKDNVNLQAFIRKELTGADEDEKRRFIAALQKQKVDKIKEMRRTVFKNYAEFVNVSKEISTLENDMLELKELLSEWKTVPQLMGMDDTLAPKLDKDGNIERHRSRRNSPRDLKQMYRQQLTNLWSTVEGSQKFIPQAPGRRLVYETHGFVELNSATYKAKQNVSLFLLNDLLLVAGRRRVKTGAGASSAADMDHGRMVAERCWVLTDLIVVDLKDSGELTNALKIKRGKETFVYRASKASEKKTLLSAFRQVSQDLADKRRKENEAEQERRRTMWQGDSANARMTRMSMFMNLDQSSGARPLSAIGTSMAETKDLLWIDEFGDDLTMAIAMRDWDESVKLVERGQDLLRTVANNPEATEMLQSRLDSLRPTVIQRIAHDLSSVDIRKGSAARLIALLTRLDCAELARDTFLKARHDLTVRLVRGIKHEGDISLYINELAVVCFTIIRHTSDWYLNAFKDSRMASGFVNWAKEQIEYFGNVFRKQVYAPSIDQSVVDECLRVTASANKRYLRDVGLDFTFLINALTAADPSSASAREAEFAPGVGVATNEGMPRRPAQSRSHQASFASSVSSSSSIPMRSDLRADPELSQGSTAPLSINRRRPSAMSPPDTGSPVGGSNANGLLSGSMARSPGDASNMSRSPGGASTMSRSPSGATLSVDAPRPPPRSERRSRPPPPPPTESLR